MRTKPLLVLFSYLIVISTSNIFSQNAGEIIFSSKLIDPQNPTNLISSFNAGDNIYSVAFLPKTVTALRNQNSKYVDVEVFIYELKPPLYDYQQPYEEQIDFSNLKVSGDALSNKYVLLDIVPATESITAYTENLAYEKFGKEFYGPVKFAKALSRLTPGEHTIVVKISINYESVAEGKFKINGNDFSSYNDIANNLNEAAEYLKYKDAGFPKSAMNDKKLESEMIAVLKNSQTYKDRIKGEVIKLVIIDPDWIIRRNEITGIILHRYIRAAAAVKNADGTCTVWQLITFQQDYVSNKFGKTKFDGVGDPYKIPCENIK